MTDSKNEDSDNLKKNDGNIVSSNTNKMKPRLIHSQLSNASFGSFSGTESSARTARTPSHYAITQLSTSMSFPRVSLRSILMNSPFSRRTKPRRVTKTSKGTIELESTCFSCETSEAGPSSFSPGVPLKRGIPLSSGGSVRPSTVGTRNNSQSGPKGKSGSLNIGPTSSEADSVGNPISAKSLKTLDDLASPSTSSAALKECSLCLQEIEDDKFPELLTCSHSSCLNCLKQYLIVEITESRVNISCPQCHQLMHPTDIHQILNNSILSYKYEDFMLRRVLSMDPDTRWCPAPDCGYAVIAAGCASCPKLKCERPGCEAYFCYHCKAEWHPNQTCDMARAQRSPNAPFSSFSHIHDLLNNDEVKACPRCQVLIVKMDDGSCNHITCSVCSAEFCWLCMKEISDLHYLSPSGCTFWGKKPWSRKKKIMWQLGTLVGAPLGIGLIAGLAVPAMIIGIPIWVGRKIHSRYASKSRHKRNLAMVGGITASAVVSPILAGLAVSIGVPILLAYVYGVVPISLCRSGGCGVITSASGVRIAFDDENDVVIGIPGRQSAEPSQSAAGNPSIGEVSCGASFSAESGAHLMEDSDRESASNIAIAPSSLAGSIASSCLSRSHRLEVQVHGNRSLTSVDTNSLATSERLSHTLDVESSSTKALAGSLLQYKLTEHEEGDGGHGDSVSGVVEASSLSANTHHQHHVTNIGLHHPTTSLSESGSAVLNTDTLSALDMRLDSVSAIITARQMSAGGRTAKGVTFNDSMERIVDHLAFPLDTDEEEEEELLRERSLKGCSAISSASNSVVLEMEEENEDVAPRCSLTSLMGDNCPTDMAERPLIPSESLVSDSKARIQPYLRRSVSVMSDCVCLARPPRSKSFPKLDSI